MMMMGGRSGERTKPEERGQKQKKKTNEHGMMGRQWKLKHSRRRLRAQAEENERSGHPKHTYRAVFNF